MNAPAASILVIDDEPDLRTLYELTLLREGYRVETASTVQEAREQLKSRIFDVVISDMRLPDGFGMEILQDLRDQQRRERCVVMTASATASSRSGFRKPTTSARRGYVCASPCVVPRPPPTVRLKPCNSPFSTMAMKPRSCAKMSTSLTGGTAKAALNLRGR